jgi:hypothetical protein
MKQKVNRIQEATTLEGRYANHIQIGHNSYEFVIDFGQLYAGNEEARFHTRIIVTPIYAKAFLDVLKKSIEQYERHYGDIPREC